MNSEPFEKPRDLAGGEIRKFLMECLTLESADVELPTKQGLKNLGIFIPEKMESFIMAAGSASEVEYQLLLARDLGFLSEGSYKEQQAAVAEIRRMLRSFIRKLRPDT